jgi:hypothetical protein
MLLISTIFHALTQYNPSIQQQSCMCLPQQSFNTTTILYVFTTTGKTMHTLDEGLASNHPLFMASRIIVILPMVFICNALVTDAVT